MKTNFLLLLTLVLSNLLCFSQSEKEKKFKSTSVTVDMYQGTQNEKAKEFFNQASEKAQSEDFKTAVKLYKKAIQEDNKFVEAYDNMGRCYRNLGDFNNAIDSYKKSIELYPNGSTAHVNLGVVYNKQKKFKESIEEYKKVQEINPNDPEGYYGIMDSYLQLRDCENAIKCGLKAVELFEAAKSPYTKDAEFYLGYSYMYNKDNKNAKKYLKLSLDHGVSQAAEYLKQLEK